MFVLKDHLAPPPMGLVFVAQRGLIAPSGRLGRAARRLASAQFNQR
jgi:hypothetical protein